MIITLLQGMFDYEFMRNAFLAGTIAAVLTAVVGYFVVIRQLAFAGHALGHVGFAGAAGAGLISISPVTGQLFLTLLAAGGMGWLGNRAGKSDIAIGLILAFSLGLGVLFLYFYSSYAGQAMAILFGDILGVSNELLLKMLWFSIPCLLALGIISRPLLFASLEPELAQARGVPLTFISILFLLITAIAVTEGSQVVGVLLVFTLLIGPPAAALQWAKNFWSGIGLSVIFGLLTVWLGIILSYLTDWPSSFWISFLSLLIYIISVSKNYLLEK